MMIRFNIIQKLLLIFLVLITSNSIAQNNKSNGLDRFFAGVPLAQNLDHWFDYIAFHPCLGLDSISERGGYSSLKKDIATAYPFPDSIVVKLLFQKIIYVDTVTQVREDSTYNIAIEGVFGNDKSARKEAIACYRKTRKELKPNYRVEDPGELRFYSFFTKGKNDFLPCLLYQGYSDELDFYFVMLVYDSKWLKEY